ncbi:MAG: CDP-diacylglycerol--serine O-phosphatidyltransferase [Ignavibacteriales bacterium]|nr:CDP-diacylglycerol--serine O-phosphatidyltransferase [Ignavibacteriales bacterium]
MKNIRITRSVIPNLFTTLNMFSGFVSIIYSHDRNFTQAAILIIVAAVFDALDGIMARLTKSSSEFGVELDSLSDLVSFGVAPAFLVYQIYLNQFNIFGIVLSSFIMIAGGLRLARFNVQLVGFDKSSFVGLPIPSSAITIASFVLIYFRDGAFIPPFENFVIPMVIVLAFLMVSKIRYETIPKFTKKGIKDRPYSFGFIFLSFVLMIFTKGKALFYIFVFIILLGILRYIYTLLFSKNNYGIDSH